MSQPVSLDSVASHPSCDTAVPEDLAALEAIRQRVLWLSTSMIHHANRVRPNPTGLKVGGHQASCASMVSIMTSLWFEHLRPGDRVSVKPHASPVLHSINYLLGELDEKYLTTLREFGGLQSYPSRSKDPDTVDYSTGSVGIGATAPIWGAMARRYVDTHLGDTGRGRQYSLVGDAELDEGAVWEAILDPGIADLGEVVWIVDLNRQSLDRVVPNIAARQLGEDVRRRRLAGDHRQIRQAARRTVHPPRRGCAAHPHPRDAQPGIPTPVALHRSRSPRPAARQRRRGHADRRTDRRPRRRHADRRGPQPRWARPAALSQAYRQIDDTRPTVIIAYTIKGYGLPTEGTRRITRRC